MITTTPVKTAGKALHYFSNDNYYTLDEGLEKSEWYGGGAEALGLSGQIGRKDFLEVLHGNLPDQDLGRIVRNQATGELERAHRPGLDVTFSAPKSVSLLAEVAGNREVRAAHEEAVKSALKYIESELAMTRQMHGGELAAVKTNSLLVAMFRHNTSRELDPQTHTHAVIMNATQRDDGKWRSLSNEEIWRSQRVIGAIYTGELAARLQALGYDLQRTDDKGNFEIKGISREQIEHFSRRRAEIEAALKERGVDINSATAHDKEMATLMTRAKKVDVDHVALIQEWQARAHAVHLDLGAIEAKAKAALEAGGVVRDDLLSGRQALEFAAAHLIEREAVVSQQDLMRVALEHGALRVSPRETLRAFEQLEAEGHLIRLPDGNYTTAKMLGSEEWALDQVRAEKGRMPAIMAADAVREKLLQQESQQGFAFTAGQTEAIHTALTTQDRYIAVQGLAGTGKTTMLRSLRILAQEQGYTVRGMAPTGAASKVLARETGIATNTVSMFQIKERQLQKDIAFAREYAPDFERKAELWIVDESSFLSQRQMAQLDFMAAKAGAKVVYLGDTLQLQGVEAGKPFELAQMHGDIETAHMTEISRQKTSELKKAVDIITGRDEFSAEARLTDIELKHNARAFAHMDQHGMVTQVDDGELLQAAVKHVLELGGAERERTIVITAFNRDRQAINEGVRAGLQAAGEIASAERKSEIYVSKGWTRAMIKEAQYYRPGDVVRFGRDYQQISASKGEYARVQTVDGMRGVVLLNKADGEVIAWEPKRHNNVEVYDAERRQIAQGDLIRFTRNEGDFKNGEVARVQELDGDRIKLLLKQGGSVTLHDVNLERNKHWDHAHAVTVHASQGATEHRAIFVIRTPKGDSERKQERMEKAMAKVFGSRSFYVGSTRASHELRIYTNDKVAAARVISQQQDKSSAVETMRRYDMDQNKRIDVAR